MQNSLKPVSAGNIPDEVNVIIEIPANSSPIKYEIDKETGAMFVDRFISTPMFYPCNYGFVPETLSDDGDPTDILVITPYPLIHDSVIKARPIGILYMTDEAGKDSKILAVPIDKLCKSYHDIKCINDVGITLKKQIEHFFTYYKDLEEGKWVKIDGWGNSIKAKKSFKLLLTITINNFFQIGSGKYRGKKINFPYSPVLRPTLGRIRETLFNWIQFESYNKTYLDLFTGSGALSFEALSRGAKQVISFEKDYYTYQNLQKNKALLKTNKINIFNQDALNFLSHKSTQTFDFIFLDPPFNKNYLPKTLKALINGNYITLNTKIYIESEFKISENIVAKWLSTNIQINKQNHAGKYTIA